MGGGNSLKEVSLIKLRQDALPTALLLQQSGFALTRAVLSAGQLPASWSPNDPTVVVRNACRQIVLRTTVRQGRDIRRRTIIIKKRRGEWGWQHTVSMHNPTLHYTTPVLFNCPVDMVHTRGDFAREAGG